MISSAYFELRQNKEEVFHLLSETAHSLSETITTSSINALNSSNELESLITERLLNSLIDNIFFMRYGFCSMCWKIYDIWR